MAELTKEDIIAVLKQCYDPEIPVDLWNLGLIYNIAYDNQSAGPVDVDITMSLTTPGCGMADQMAHEAKEKLGFYPTPAPSEKTESNEWE